MAKKNPRQIIKGLEQEWTGRQWQVVIGPIKISAAKAPSKRKERKERKERAEKDPNAD